MPDFTCLDENLFAKVAQTLLQHISSTHCNFKSALGPSILLLCVRLADVQMNGFINYCGGGSAPVLLGRKRKQDTAAAAVVIRIQDKRNHVVVGEVRNHEFTIEDRL